MTIRLLASYLFFYLRVCIVAMIAFSSRLIIRLFPATRRVAAEACLIKCCNHLFRQAVPVPPFLDRDQYYEFLDIADFRTLNRRLGLPDDWYHGLTVLDVGCGHGKLSRLIAVNGAAFVEGIDIADSSIAYADRVQENDPRPNIRLRVRSVYELDFPDDHFDAVISQVVFEHIDDIPRALAEIHRVLKPGGRFYFTIDAFRSRYGAHMAHFVHVPWPLVFFSEEACRRVWCEGLDEARMQCPGGEAPDFFQWCMSLPSLNRVTLSELDRLIEAAGFAVEGVTHFADERPLLAVFPWRRLLPGVYEYLRGSSAYLLQKKGAQQS